jgi:predicted HTH domain antitoxin
MSVKVSVDLPEHAFSALRMRPDNFVKEMRLAAAIKWYEMGLISQSKASELAGVNRFKVSPFQVTPEELAEEMADA